MKLFIGNIENNIAELREDEQHHIVKVLRMNNNDDVFVTDGKGKLIQGKLQLVGKRAEVVITKTFLETEVAKNSLHIAIAPTKNIDRFEFFLEKAVELGISEITPLLTANSERKIIKEDKLLKQIESACKQSLRSLFPVLNPLTEFKDFINKENNNLFISHCYNEYKRTSIHELLPVNGGLTVLIGPEGDFSKKEVEEIYSLNATGVSLGNNRLRTETAGIFVAASHYYSIL